MRTESERESERSNQGIEANEETDALVYIERMSFAGIANLILY